MGRKEHERKQKNKGPARQPVGSVVFKARAELNRTVIALRHSNAVAAYLLGLFDGPVRIPKDVYSKLLVDDETAIKWTEDGTDMVISIPSVTAGRVKVTPGPGGDQNRPRTTHVEPATPETTIGRPVPGIRVTDTILGGGIERTARERKLACTSCGQPADPALGTGLCGVCTFGTAEP